MRKWPEISDEWRVAIGIETNVQTGEAMDEIEATPNTAGEL